MKENTKWLAFLNLFRSLHPRIETQTISIFLTVAQYEGRTQAEIAKMLDTTQASVSRNLALLANYSEVEMGLVRLEESLDDRRAKIISLTPAGRSLLLQIKALS
jgi:DNA-binding MarR family transcriptional regulator